MTRAEKIIRTLEEQESEVEKDPELQLVNTQGYAYAGNTRANKGPRYVTGKKPSGIGSGTGESS